MSNILERARQLRAMIEQNAETMPDETAKDYTELFPQWKVGIVFAEEDVGKRVSYNGKLWKVRLTHTAQEDWAPDVAPTLFEEVSVNPEAGTKENPIEYSGNMTLEEGKYYMQDGVVYLCNRDTGNPVYNTLSELVGVYVEVSGLYVDEEQ